MPHHFGLIPSVPDSRDWSASKLLKAAPPPPDSSNALLQYVSVHDQGPTETCVWFATAQAVHIWLKSQGLADEWISTLFGYWNTLQQQGQIVDAGCQPRIALQVLSQAGFCAEKFWPFDPTQVLQQPPPDAYTAANDNKTTAGSYYLIDSSGSQKIQDIKTAIAAGYPVIYGSPVDQMYENYTGGVMSVPNGTPLGGHQRCLVAYTADYVQEVNSWGPNWGENGLARISWEIATWDQASDFWVFDRVPKPTA